MIGFYDPYLFESSNGKLNPPNVDIMKLATYYKEQNVFNRLILPGESVESYDKVYCFSEKPCIVPDTLKRATNVFYGGTYFTQGEYMPFEDSLINYTVPKVGVYYPFLKQCQADPKAINDFLDNAYYRVGEENLPYPAPVIQSTHRLYIYDRNLLEREDWKKIINSAASHKPSTIVFIHPIYCRTLSQFFALRENSKISRENEIVLNLALPSSDVSLMFKKYLHLFLAEITPASRIYLQLGGNYPTATQYYQNFIYTLNLLYCFWAKNVPIKIFYKEPSVGYNNPIENLSKMVSNWSISAVSPRKRDLRLISLFHKSVEDDRKAEYDKLIRNFPSAANLFTQSYNLLELKKYWGF